MKQWIAPVLVGLILSFAAALTVVDVIGGTADAPADQVAGPTVTAPGTVRIVERPGSTASVTVVTPGPGQTATRTRTARPTATATVTRTETAEPSCTVDLRPLGCAAVEGSVGIVAGLLGGLVLFVAGMILGGWKEAP